MALDTPPLPRHGAFVAPEAPDAGFAANASGAFPFIKTALRTQQHLVGPLIAPARC
jgi:hypothetical protein